MLTYVGGPPSPERSKAGSTWGAAEDRERVGGGLSDIELGREGAEVKGQRSGCGWRLRFRKGCSHRT